MGSSSVRLLLVLAVVLALSASPAAAAPRWSEPQTLSPPGANHAQAAVDARGNTLVVWWQRLEADVSVNGYRWWLPGRGWTAARYTARELGLATDVAITPLGEATVLLAGQRAERVPLGVATASPGQALGDYEPITAAASGGSGFALGVDDVGNAVVAWGARDERQSVMVSARRAGGRFGAAQTVGEGSSGGGFDVAMNPAGAAAVTWWAQNGGRPQVAYRAPGGSFGWAEDTGLGGPGGSRLGIDVAGRVVVSSDLMVPYVGQPDYNVAGGSSYSIRSPLGEWSEPQGLDQSGFVSSLLVEPRGAITFLIDHRESTPGAAENRAVRRAADGRLAGERLSSGPAHGWALGTLNLRGDLLAAWGERAADGQAAEIVVRERPVGAGAFGPPVALAQSAHSVETPPALNDLGQALVAWTDRTADGQLQVRAAVRADSALPSLPAPPDVDVYADPLAALDPDGDLLAPVRCATSCKVTATGVVFPGGAGDAVAGRGKAVRLRARRTRRVKLDFGAAGAEAVRHALAAGARPWASVSVSARGRSPRPLVVSRRYRLGR